MSSYGVQVWALGSAIATEAIFFTFEYVYSSTHKSSSFDSITRLVMRLQGINFAVLVAAALNSARHPLTIPMAITIGIGVPSAFSRLVNLFYSSDSGLKREKKRAIEIDSEADELGRVRRVHITNRTPHGISYDVEEILAARRDALTGHLPTVDTSDEGGVSR